MIRNKIVLALVGALALGAVGCEEKHETRKIVFEGPQEKHEVKIEKTEKHQEHHEDSH